jgi:hypothetical protein
VYATLRESFGLEEYRPGAPTLETARIDREVCEESACDDCGALSPRYYPFTHRRRGLYRAFAVCRACGHIEEI